MKVKFSKKAGDQLKKHNDILSEEEIKAWVKDSKRDREQLSDGFCLKRKIRRKNREGYVKDNIVSVYYRTNGTIFEVYHIHVGTKIEKG